MSTVWGVVIPQGDWVDTYPTTNGRIIQGIRLAFLFVLFVLGLITLVVGVAFFGPAEKIKLVPWDVVDGFLQLLGWFIVGLMGVAAAQFIGKRATTSPETVKAVSDAKIAEAQTGTFPLPVLAKVLTKEAAAQPASPTTVMKTANAVKDADPNRPIGELVDGDGD